MTEAKKRYVRILIYAKVKINADIYLEAILHNTKIL